jgi:hypothetical protein
MLRVIGRLFAGRSVGGSADILWMDTYSVEIVFDGLLGMLASFVFIDYQEKLTRGGIVNRFLQTQTCQHPSQTQTSGEVMQVKEGILTTKKFELVCGNKNNKVSS